MVQKKHRLLAAVLSVVLILGLTPWNALAAEGELPALQAEHASHPSCGLTCEHGDHEAVNDWQPFSLEDGGQLTGGSYYLADDVTLLNTLVIPADSEVNLCLNGHTLTGPGASSYDPDAIEVKGNGTLTICDCSAEGTGTLDGRARFAVSVDEGGELNLYSGNFTGTASNGVVDNDGTLKMYGGSVTGGRMYAVNTSGIATIGGTAKITSTSSSGVAAVGNNAEDAVLTIEGSAEISGPNIGVENDGSVTISGGTIKGGTYGFENEKDCELVLQGTPDISGGTAALSLNTDQYADSVPVDARGYTGKPLTVVEQKVNGTENMFGESTIQVRNANKDSFLLMENSWYYAYVYEGDAEEGVLKFGKVSYAITQQPTAENHYTVAANGSPTGYQWYSAEPAMIEVNGIRAKEVEGSVYNGYTGYWENTVAKAENSEDPVTANLFAIELEAGDVVAAEVLNSSELDGIGITLAMIPEAGDPIPMRFAEQ